MRMIFWGVLYNHDVIKCDIGKLMDTIPLLHYKDEDAKIWI